MTIAGDCAIAAVVLVVIVLLRRHVIPANDGLLPPEKFPLDWINLGTACGTLVLALALNGFYVARTFRRNRPSMVAAMLLRVSLAAVMSALMQRPMPRTILFVQPFLEPALLLAWHRVVVRFAPIRAKETILVGTADEVRAFVDMVVRHDDRRVHVTGYVVPSGHVSRAAAPDAAAPAGETPALLQSAETPALLCLGTLDDAACAEKLRVVEEVVDVHRDSAIRLRLFELRGPAGYLALPSEMDALLMRTTLAWLGDQPLVEISAAGAFGVGAALKRMLDLGVASLLLIVTLPVWLLAAVAIALESGFPIILKQERIGQFGSVFRMLKFRSLRNASDSSGLVRDGDERVTRVGSWIRRHRIDELPQLVNVLRGEMSLVGPRPEQVDLHRKICEEVSGFALRLIVRPGISGLAQVSAEYDSDSTTKLRYDLSYICSWSLWLDLRILVQSVSTALSGRGL